MAAVSITPSMQEAPSGALNGLIVMNRTLSKGLTVVEGMLLTIIAALPSFPLRQNLSHSYLISEI